MSRTISVGFSILLIGAAVAAIVRAQDNNTEPKETSVLVRSGERSGDDANTSSRYAREPAPIVQRDSAQPLAPIVAADSPAVRTAQRPSPANRGADGGGLAPIVDPPSVQSQRQREGVSAEVEPPVELQYTAPGARRRQTPPDARQESTNRSSGNSLRDGSIRQQPIRDTQRFTPGTTNTTTPLDPTAEEASDRGASPLPQERQDSQLLITAVPALAVEASGPRAVQVGKEVTYRVSAVNLGASSAIGVVIRIELPDSMEINGRQPTIGEADISSTEPGQQRIEWQIDELGGRAQEHLDVRVSPKTAQMVDLKIEWIIQPIQAIAHIEVQEPQLDVSIVGPRTIVYGRTEVYTVMVSNPGTGIAEGVTLQVAPGSGAAETQPIGSIPPGGREIIKLELTAGEPGAMPIRAVASTPSGLRKEFIHEVTVRQAQLSISIDGPPVKYAGSTASYLIRVHNEGDAIAEDVEAAVAMPSGAKYISGIENAKVAPKGVQWRVGSLQPGEERTFRMQCELALAGDNRFRAIANSQSGNDANAAFATRVEALADLKLLVNDPQGPKPVGEDVIYEIVVVNRGTKSAQNVKVIGHFSDGIEPTSAEGAGFEIMPGQVEFAAVKRIGAGERVVLKIKARAEKSGNHRFRAEVIAADPETKLLAEEATRFFDEAPISTARRP
ncbi:MAG: hypothetical protein QGG36_10180 [Pirellulaceae bacterium]|jgi:uncharacterized repeat protein (TIGR01451 family)|nr:hypothetical protein [Pirellulaceae bacterium]MDP7016158.1 hypothetical protein [Pirellulaceae bacterium]